MGKRDQTIQWRTHDVELLDRIVGKMKAMGRWEDGSVGKAFDIARNAPDNYHDFWLELDDDLNATWVPARGGREGGTG